MPFLITLLSLGFVIFIHELGHLLAAKRAFGETDEGRHGAKSMVV